MGTMSGISYMSIHGNTWSPKNRSVLQMMWESPRNPTSKDPHFAIVNFDDLVGDQLPK